MLGKLVIGMFSIISINQMMKDKKNPRTKEEIKEDARNTANTIKKYTTALVEVAQETLENINTQDKSHEIEIDNYFKNIKKDGR